MEPLAEKSTKLSSVSSIGFRPGPVLSEKIDTLVDEVAERGGKTNPTLVIREGMLAFWPQIRTHLLVRHTTPTAHSDDVARIVGMAQKAIEHGLTIDQIEQSFTREIEQRLAG